MTRWGSERDVPVGSLMISPQTRRCKGFQFFVTCSANSNQMNPKGYQMLLRDTNVGYPILWHLTSRGTWFGLQRIIQDHKFWSLDFEAGRKFYNFLQHKGSNNGWHHAWRCKQHCCLLCWHSFNPTCPEDWTTVTKNTWPTNSPPPRQCLSPHCEAHPDFLQETGLHLLPHAPYSPDLAPCDFWLFPRVKVLIAGNPFARVQDLAKAVHSAA